MNDSEIEQNIDASKDCIFVCLCMYKCHVMFIYVKDMFMHMHSSILPY